MIHAYQGHFVYDQNIVSDWDSMVIGVYYCGLILPSGNLLPLYIGKATGQDGIKGRLLQHLNQDNWPEVTHFGCCACDTVKEAEDFETSEILQFNPKYNIQSKSV